MRRYCEVIVFAILMLCVTLVQAQERFQSKAATAEQLAAIQSGGYVLFIRHGPTDSSLPDHVPVDLNDCSTQRPLTDSGRALMRQVGEDFHRARIPYEVVYSSPLCRAMETAGLIFGEDGYQVDANLLYVAALTSDEKQPVIARTLELLTAPVPAHTNRVLVAHGPNLVEVMEYFPVEGTLVIIEPHVDGQGFTYVASIEPHQWSLLSGEWE